MAAMPSEKPKRRLTTVTQVRLSPLQHAYLSARAGHVDASMGAYLRAWLDHEMRQAAEDLGSDVARDLDLRLELGGDAELVGDVELAQRLADRVREWDHDDQVDDVA
jgi:hypothetical protein